MIFRGQRAAARKDMRHVVSRLLRRRDQRDIASHHAADERLEQREVRAPQHERVDVAAAQRLEVLAGDLLERRTDVHGGHEGGEILDGALGHAQALLGYLHETRRGRGEHGDAGIEMADGLGIGVRLHRGLRGDHAHAAVLRGMGRSAGARLHHADDRHGKRPLRMRQAGRRGRVARDDDELHPALDQPRADLLHEAVDLVQAARPVGAACRISQVDDGFAR